MPQEIETREGGKREILCGLWVSARLAGVVPEADVQDAAWRWSLRGPLSEVWWARVLLTVVLVVLVMISGCRGLWEGHPSPAEKVPRLAWPPPPATPRIELVALFDRGSHLGIREGFWRSVANLLAGTREPRLVRPTSVAVTAGRFAVADAGSAHVHVYDFSSHRAFYLEECAEAKFRAPVAVAFLGERLYVADSAAARIHVFDRAGGCEGGWALNGASRPAGLAADEVRSRLYVGDTGAHRVVAFGPRGERQLSIGRRGDGPGEFNYPGWLAVDGTGNLHVTDALNSRVQIFDSDGNQLSSFGKHGDGSGDLARPKGIGVDTEGHIYVVDALFDAVQIFDREGRYLMVFGSRGSQAGQMWLPSGLAIAGDRIYVADSYNGRIQVFRFMGLEE